MPRISSLFSSAERGGGSPRDCITIRRGAETWTYTNGDATQTVRGVDYLPASIRCKALEQKNDLAGTQFTVTLKLDTAAGQALLVQSPFPVTVSLARVQSAGDPIQPVLLGDVISTKLSTDEMELTVATIEHSFKTRIPKTVIQRVCPWAWGSTSCGVNKDDFAHSTTIDTISGQVITLSTMADSSDGFYTNGVIVLGDGRPIFIAKQVGLACTVWARVPDDVAEGDSVTVYPGCDKQFSTCETKFDNAENFGGFPNLPTRNPLVQAI